MYTIYEDKLYKGNDYTKPSTIVKLTIKWDDVYLQRRDCLLNLLKNLSPFPKEKKEGDN